MAGQTGFSFYFLPHGDRIAMSLAPEEGHSPAPVLLTCRMVKMLGDHLHHYVEKNTQFAVFHG